MSTPQPVTASPAPVAKAAPAASTVPPPAVQLRNGAAPTTAQQPLTVVVAKMPEETSDFTGDLVSGGIGAVSTLAAVFLTLWLTNSQKKREERQRADDYCVEAYAKIAAVYEFAHGFVDHFKVGAARAKAANAEFVSLHVQAYANIPPEVIFTQDEMTALRRVSNYKLLNSVPMIERKYRSVLQTMIMYRARIEDIQRLATVEKVENGVSTVSFPNEVKERVRAEYGMLDGFVTTMNEHCEELVQSCFESMKVLVESMATYFNRYQGISVTDPQGQVVEFEFNLKKKKKLRGARV
jgi:hypothetical protein